MRGLLNRKCEACKRDILPLKGTEIRQLQDQLSGWICVDEHHLEKKFEFETYKQGLEFANNLGNLAEEQGHHPIMKVDFKKVTVTFYTHKINGLTEADFIMAAKTDPMFDSVQKGEKE